jgi:hypothetical protein
MRRSLLVLWLLIALLPLRGWAHARMAMADLAPVVVTATTAETADQGVMPCHGASSDDTSMSSEADTTVPSHLACSLCSLCHAAFATAPDMRWPAFALPAPPPSSGRTDDLGRVTPERLERPPRSS